MKTLITLALLLTSTSAFACPMFNGTYERIEGGNHRSRIEMRTEVLGDSYRYSLGGGELMEATGTPTRVASDGLTGSITVSCGDSSMSYKVAVDGGERFNLTVTRIDATQLEFSSDAAFGLNGIYTKQ